MANPDEDPTAIDTASPVPWDWVPQHWGTDVAPQVEPATEADTAASEAPPPVTPPVMQDPTPQAPPPDVAGPALPDMAGPSLPPQPGPLDGSLFDPSSPPTVNPADAAGADIPPDVSPADAAAEGLPPIADEGPPTAAPVPYGAAPVPADTAPPAPPAAPVLGPQLPTAPPRPIQTPYGWDPLAGTEFETKHIDPTAEDPFAGVSEPAGYSDITRLATEHPEVLAQLTIEQDKRRKIAESRARIEADQADLAQLKQNLADRQAADARTQKQLDQINADAQKLAHQPLDRRRWFKDKSLLGKIATVFAAVVGGLATPRGGRNMGLEFVEKQMDDDIADQKADIENERGGLAARQTAVAQEFARTGNLYQAAETVRLATRQALINKLQTDQQNFDPRGTGYLEYGKLIQQQLAGMARVSEDQRKTSFEEQLKLIEAERKAQADAETRRQHLAEEALARAKEARAGAGKERETTYTPEQLKILNPSATIAPPIPMTQTEFTKWQGAQKAGEELATARRANDPETLAREQQVPNIVTESGKPVQFLPNEVADIKKAMFNAVELNRMNDELVGLVEKHGFDTGWTKSDYYLRAQQIFSAMVLRAKEQDKLGALSGGDVDIEHKNIGTNDPTQLRDTLAGLRSFRHQTTEGINSLVQTHAIIPPGEHLKRWDPSPLITSAPESAKLTGKTLAEHVDEAKPGKITKALMVPGVREALSVLPGYAKPDDYQRNAANIPVGPTGLALEDDAKVGDAIHAYGTAPPKAQDAIVDQLKVWANSNRPSVASGVLGLIQGENPALYERVLSQLPSDVQKQRREFDAVRAKFPGANLPPPPAGKRTADSPKDDE